MEKKHIYICNDNRLNKHHYDIYVKLLFETLQTA